MLWRIGVPTLLLVVGTPLMLWPYYGHVPCDVTDAVREARYPTDVLDGHGRRITTTIAARGRYIPLDELPAFTPLAFVSVEDQRMNAWYHRGVDPVGVATALWSNVWHPSRGRRGSSTIAMQLGRALCEAHMPPDGTWRGKLAEAGLGLWLTQQLGKRQVLELYLNTVFLGRGVHGIDAGARTYYGKAPERLTASDAAELAYLVANPGRRDPLRTQMPARRRVLARVLAKMAALDRTAIPRAATAVLSPVRARRGDGDAPIRRVARSAIAGCEPGVDCPPSVRTFRDSRLQQAAQRELDRLLARLAPPAIRVRARRQRPARRLDALFVAVDARSGRVLAYAGQSSAGPSDVLRYARIQPASTIKPTLLAAALDDALLTPATTLGWLRAAFCPGNELHAYLERLSGHDASTRTITEAMARSDNVLGACLLGGLPSDPRSRLADAGMLATADAPAVDGLGIQPVDPVDLALAYAAIFNHGVRPAARFTTLDSVASSTRLFSVAAADTTAALLRRIAGVGTAHWAAAILRGDPTFGGKTGTAQSNRELTFVGYTRGVVAVLWVGVVAGKGPVSMRNAGDVVAEPWARIVQVAETPRVESTPRGPLPRQTERPAPRLVASAPERP